MVEQVMDLIIVINFIIFIGLVTGLLWWQKRYGTLNAKKFALIITGYFSIAFVITLFPLLITNTRVTIIVDIVFL